MPLRTLFTNLVRDFISAFKVEPGEVESTAELIIWWVVIIDGSGLIWILACGIFK